MSLRNARLAMALSALLLTFASASGAAVLWDQSAIDFGANSPGVLNYNFTGFGGYEFYSVNNVTVPAGGWTINTITEYWSDWQGVDMNITAGTGNLIIMPKTAGLPVGAPTTTPVALTWVDTVQNNQGVYVMTLSGLNVVLPAGEYWITVAPNARQDNFFGNNQMWPAAMAGSPVATWYAGSWSAMYGNFDGAFKIEGLNGGATATRSGTWGGLKALYR